MTYAADAKLGPGIGADHGTASRQQGRGVALSLLGLAVSVTAFFGSLAAVGQVGSEQASTLTWTFGVTTFGLALVKAAIAVVLWGIILRLWLRAGSIEKTLPYLIGIPGADSAPLGDMDTPLGVVTVTESAPETLPVHKMAKRMFRPMIAMGLMAVAAGLVVALVAAGSSPSTSAKAWIEGLQFLGEGMLLAGIALLLGTILWALRTAGGKIQESLGVKVYTPKTPVTAKAFLALMTVGLVVEIVQFVGYLAVSGSSSPAADFAWLAPLREAGLGLILAAIALALVTIGNVLSFQFFRISNLIENGERS